MNTPNTAAEGTALAGDWHVAGRIVHEYDDPPACWIHAILHKMDGDESDSRYWYGTSAGRCYEDVYDLRAELEMVRALTQPS